MPISRAGVGLGSPAGQNRATYAAFGFPVCSHAGPVYLTITEPIRAGVGTNKG